MSRSVTLAALAVLGSAGVVVAAPGFTLDPLLSFGGGDSVITAGERDYLNASDNNTRGMAYNPLTNRVYVLTRTSGLRMAVLDGDTGADVVTPFGLTGYTGGTFVATKVRVADDGAIYVCNLNTATSGTSFFKIYRYASEADLLANNVTTAFSGTLTSGNRYGDNFNIRGGGTNTQMVVGGGTNSDDLVVFTTTDGLTFNPTILDVGVNGDNRFGVAFGPGDTIYSRGVSTSGTVHKLRRIAFNLSVPSATILETWLSTDFNAAITNIDVDPLNTLLAGTYLPGSTTVPGDPNETRLFDIQNTAVAPALLDNEVFPVNNINGNAAGEVDFGPNGRLYYLDTNNGLQAFLIPEPGTLSLLAVGGLALLRRRK
jgi:hypothetical protein